MPSAAAVFNYLTPEAPATLLAMTTASASYTLPRMHNAGLVAFLRNEASVTAYVQFGATATAAAGSALDPLSTMGPIAVPEAETKLSAILGSGTGNLRIVLGFYR